MLCVVAPGRFDLLVGGGRVRRGVHRPAGRMVRVVLGCPRSRWPRHQAVPGLQGSGPVRRKQETSGQRPCRAEIPSLSLASERPGGPALLRWTWVPRTPNKASVPFGRVGEWAPSASTAGSKFPATSPTSRPPGAFPAVPLRIVQRASPFLTRRSLLPGRSPTWLPHAPLTPQKGRLCCFRGCAVTASCRCVPCEPWADPALGWRRAPASSPAEELRGPS